MREPPAILDGPEAIRDHVELTVSRAECAKRGVRFVLCDPTVTVRAHCHVDDLPEEMSEEECARAIRPFVTAMRDLGGGGHLVVVIPRRGTATVTDSDRRWFRAAVRMCREYDACLLSVRVLTPRDHREVVLDDV
jgi:hypothetical protein